MTHFLKISAFLFALILVTGTYAQEVDWDLLSKHHAASQIPQFINPNDVIKHNIKDPFFQNEEGFDKSVFENHPSQILKVRTFDSTSVVDSVINLELTYLDQNKNRKTKQYQYLISDEKLEEV